MTRSRNTRSPARLRALARLAALLAGPAVALIATLGATAYAGGVPTGAWSTQTNQGSRAFSTPAGTFTIANNVLSSQAWQQTIWATSPTNWGVETAQPASTSVVSYPSVQQAYSVQYLKMRRLRSSYAEEIPNVQGIVADAAYTMWLTTPASQQISVVMRVDARNPGRPQGSFIGTAYFYFKHFRIFNSGNTFTFVQQGPPEPHGHVHLLSALRWLATHHKINQSDLLNEVDFGWHITSTGNLQASFKATRYSVDFVRKHAPALAKPSSIGSLSVATWVFVGGLIAVFAALFVVVLLLFGRFDRASRGRTLTGMFERYGPQRTPEPATIPEVGGRVAIAAVGAMQKVMTPRSQDRLAKRLDLAGSTRKPAEWALFGVCVGVGIAATLSLVTSYVFLGVVAGAVLGWLAMRLSLSMRILRRRSSFSDQLPDILQLIASTLRAGFSLPQALDAVTREVGQPAAAEFSRAMAESRIGADLDVALEAVANRMDSDDLRWTVLAIRIQQGVGGNLAEVLLTIAGTIRERAFLRRQVRALSAEGRLSAYVLIALPLMVGAWLFISAPGYMAPLYTTPLGDLMLFFAVGLLLVGAFWMNRTIKVEV